MSLNSRYFYDIKCSKCSKKKSVRMSVNIDDKLELCPYCGFVHLKKSVINKRKTKLRLDLLKNCLSKKEYYKALRIISYKTSFLDKQTEASLKHLLEYEIKHPKQYFVKNYTSTKMASVTKEGFGVCKFYLNKNPDTIKLVRFTSYNNFKKLSKQLLKQEKNKVITILRLTSFKHSQLNVIVDKTNKGGETK